MADPATALAALGIVSNIFQVLDFTAKVVGRTYDFMNSSEDALPENKYLESLAMGLEQLDAGIGAEKNADKPLSREEEAVHRATEACQDQAADLVKQLQALKLDESRRGVKRALHGTVKAFKAMHQRKEIEEKRRKLQELSSSLSTQLLRWLRVTLNSRHNSLLDMIGGSAESITETILTSQKTIIRAFSDDQNYAKADRIADSLCYNDFKLRRDAIEEAYDDTFKWLWTEESHGFRRWLRSGANLYWISGKAGSGKSTLMKYLFDHPNCHEILLAWAGDAELVSVQFYFWYLGSPMQKSVEGLLQSILYQILRKCPKLVPHACQERWRAHPKSPSEIGPWSKKELYATLQNISDAYSSGERVIAYADREASSSWEQFHVAPRKFCFFIDGLDEYHGDHLMLVKYITALAQNENFKICAASRRWNIFQQAFATAPSLRLEDLTREDIAIYVESELAAIDDESLLVTETSSDNEPSENEPSNNGEMASMNKASRRLALKVLNKAEGVFLWVHLVVRSLLRGHAEGDDTDTLMRRVDDFPSDLDDFFQHILDRVDPFYAKGTAQALLLAKRIADLRLADEDNPYSSAASEFLSYWLIRESNGDLDTALEYAVKPTPAQDFVRMAHSTQQFLNSRCKDLLYIPSAKSEELQGLQLWCPLSKWMDRHSVQFLHRTVHEFLCTDSVSQLMEKHRPKCFDDLLFWERLTVARLGFVLVDEYPTRFGTPCEHYLKGFSSAISSDHPKDALSARIAEKIDTIAALLVQGGCLDHAWCRARDEDVVGAERVYSCLAEYGRSRLFAAYSSKPAYIVKHANLHMEGEDHRMDQFIENDLDKYLEKHGSSSE